MMNLTVILAYLLLMPAPSFATVWDQGFSSSKTPYNSDSFSLNEAEVILSHGRSTESLDALLQRFLAKARARNAHYFSTKAAGRLISCSVDPLVEKSTHSPLAWLKNVFAECLFARDRQGKVHYQKVTLRGLPLPSKTQFLSFAGLPFALTRGDEALHLKPHQTPSLETLALKRATKSSHSLANLRARFKESGWAEIDMPGEPAFYLTRGEESVLAREEKDRLILIHTKGN